MQSTLYLPTCSLTLTIIHNRGAFSAAVSVSRVYSGALVVHRAKKTIANQLEEIERDRLSIKSTIREARSNYTTMTIVRAPAERANKLACFILHTDTMTL